MSDVQFPVAKVPVGGYKKRFSSVQEMVNYITSGRFHLGKMRSKKIHYPQKNDKPPACSQRDPMPALAALVKSAKMKT